MCAASDTMNTAELGLRTPQSQAIAMMCRCDGTTDEGVELQVLKGLLTATTSSTFTVHGQVRLLPPTCALLYYVCLCMCAALPCD
eukprot:1157780-Pelagomonas_calceolata.AAC.17